MGSRRSVYLALDKAAQQEPPPRRQGNATIDPMSVDRVCEAVIDAVHGAGSWLRLGASEREAARQAIEDACVTVAQNAYEKNTGKVLYRAKVEP
jgi:hypothetical protein